MRLLFDEPIADRVAMSNGVVFRTAKRHWVFGAWRRRFGRRRANAAIEPPPLSAARMPSRGAIALALHLGMNETIATLAESEKTSLEQIGEDLYQARSILVHGPAAACDQFTSSIGRYRDPSLDIVDRAMMLQHAQRCDACRTTLDQFRMIDAALIEQIDRTIHSLDESIPPESQFRTISQTARWGLVAAIFMSLLVAAFLARSSWLPAKNGLVTMATDSDQSLNGWILIRDDSGQLSVIDLATGRSQPIGGPDIQPASRQFGIGSAILSPDQRLIAGQQPVENVEPQQLLTIETIGGKVVRRVALPNPYSALVGWLGNGAVLEVEQPQPLAGESQTAYSARLQTDTTVSTIDATTGERHEIFKGTVANVFPSPDASMVAITSWSNRNDGLMTIELRSIAGGQVGQVIANPAQGIYGDPVWAADSSELYAGMTSDSSDHSSPTADQLAPYPNPFAQHLRAVSISRSGTIRRLPSLPAGDSNIPIAASPDGRYLIIGSVTGSLGDNSYRLWRTSISGGQPIPLTEDAPFWNGKGIWSPDGQALLVEKRRPFLLTPSDAIAAIGDVTNTALLAILPDGRTRVIRSRINSSIGFTFLGWLPSGTFSPTGALAASGDQLGDPTPVDLLDPGLTIDNSNGSAANGAYIILHDGKTNKPIIWDRTDNTERQLPNATTGLSWFTSDQILIGAGTTTRGTAVEFSRLVTYAPSFGGSVPIYDFRAYDPANVGSDTARHYAEPLISPMQTSLAFFVTDDRDRSISLWIAGYDNPAKSVYRWVIPGDSGADVAPKAAWIDDSTLIFTEPADWNGGLPRQVQLRRMKIDSGGQVHVATLATLHTHGNERGINLSELAVSQVSGRIAYRLQHFTQATAANGSFDSVAIVTVAHMDDPIELSRQGTGVGLSWSPGGGILAASFPGELRFFSATGELIAKVGGLIDPSSPQWVSQSMIWFEATNDRTTQILSVTIY